MDYESTEYECDMWQGTVVFTDKATGKCGSLILKSNGRVATARMIKADVAKYGPNELARASALRDKALRVYAKLIEVWV